MPARFRFALQPLLDRRSRAEEEKRRCFARRQRELDDLARDRERLAAALFETVVRTSDAATLAVFDAAIAARRRGTASAERALEAARQELIPARRDRRALEKLRERRARAFEEEAARLEELEIDEANARRRTR